RLGTLFTLPQQLDNTHHTPHTLISLAKWLPLNSICHSPPHLSHVGSAAEKAERANRTTKPSAAGSCRHRQAPRLFRQGTPSRKPRNPCVEGPTERGPKVALRLFPKNHPSRKESNNGN